jgi:hypothetical protein
VPLGDPAEGIEGIGIQELHAVDLRAPAPGFAHDGVELVEQVQQVLLVDLELPGAGDVLAEQEDDVGLETERLLDGGQRVRPPGGDDVLVDPFERAQLRCRSRPRQADRVPSDRASSSMTICSDRIIEPEASIT